MVSTQRYRYNPLTSPTHTRFLYIDISSDSQRLDGYFAQLTLEDAERRDGYCALSYAWGEPEFSHSIYIEGSILSITAHLHGALSSLKQHKQKFWIDAVCIDQDNHEEKAQQIALMGQIYRRAEYVIIWLGPEDPSIVTAFQACQNGLVEEINDVALNESLGDDEKRDRTRQIILRSGARPGLNKIFENDWFHRVWTMQEALTSARKRMLCGAHLGSYGDLQLIAARVQDINQSFNTREAPIIFSLQAEAGIAELDNMGLMGFLREEEYPKAPGLELIDMLDRTSDRKCAKERDRLFALGGVLGDPNCLPYPADYKKDTATIYVNFAAHAVERYSNLHLLMYSGLARVKTYELPSWVPDWSAKPKPVFSQELPRLDHMVYRADGANQAFRQSIRVRRTSERAILSLPAIFIDKMETVWELPEFENGNLSFAGATRNLTTFEEFGYVLEQLMLYLIELPGFNISWPALWRALTYGFALQATIAAYNEEDDLTVAAALDYYLREWQAWKRSQNPFLENKMPVCDDPLVHFMHRTDASLDGRALQAFRRETNRLSETGAIL